MAEEDAEKAFFQAQTMNADSVDYNTVEGQGDNSDSDDYDPSSTLQDQYSATLTDSKQSENVSSNLAPFDSNSPNETSLPHELNPDQQAGDAYPQSIAQDETEASASMPSSTAPAQQNTKTIGGFVVDDEDEDENDKGDADYEPPAVLGVEDVNTMRQQPFSGNANQASSTPDVSFNESVPDASSKNVPNSSHSPSVSKTDVSAAPGQSMYTSQALQPENTQESAAQTPTPDPTSTSRGRLPHDRVGILEDRIQEDPRGDIPAWLELINEHRSRNRIDNAREVYERFLKVFPFAVSIFH